MGGGSVDHCSHVFCINLYVTADHTDNYHLPQTWTWLEQNKEQVESIKYTTKLQQKWIPTNHGVGNDYLLEKNSQPFYRTGWCGVCGPKQPLSIDSVKQCDSVRFPAVVKKTIRHSYFNILCSGPSQKCLQRLLDGPCFRSEQIQWDGWIVVTTVSLKEEKDKTNSAALYY